MEVVDENVALLSNFEVYDLLSKVQKQSKGKKPNGQSQNLATITYEATEYLAKTACVNQSSKVVRDFLTAMSGFKLTKAEKLQLLNLRPTSPVEIQVMVEEVEERFTEDEISRILEIIATTLPDTTELEVTKMNQRKL